MRSDSHDGGELNAERGAQYLRKMPGEAEY